MNRRHFWREEPDMHYAIAEKLRGRKRQSGQAIYLGLAAIVFLSLMTYAAFNISQMTHAKTQTMNAADAGAYTFATVAARDMNFMAYTNRAMAANHAVIGQLVSLASLSQMIYLAADDLEELQNLAWIPIIGPFLDAIGEAFEILKDIIEEVVLPGLEILATAQNGLIQLISRTQPIARAVAGADAVAATDRVIRANDPELRWDMTSVAGVLATANTITSFLSGISERVSDTDDEGLSRMREVVNLSRDGFTIERNWIPLPQVNLGTIKITGKWLFHGGSQLSSDNKTWVGVDGSEVKYQKLSWSHGFPKWKTKYTFRLWMTGETAGSNGADDWRQLSHGDLSKDGHKQAYYNRKDSMVDTYDGIQPYYELKEFKAGDRSEDSATYVVLVFKPVQSGDASNVTRTPNATQTFQTTDADNPFHLEEGRARIYGVAASQVYFRRPARSDNDPTAASLPNALYSKGTYATLFAPYWQARLTDLSLPVKEALMGVGD
jgi:hypothetical protein